VARGARYSSSFDASFSLFCSGSTRRRSEITQVSKPVLIEERCAGEWLCSSSLRRSFSFARWMRPLTCDAVSPTRSAISG